MKYQLTNYFSGTSGLVLPVTNNSHYPEAYRERSRFCHYGALMDSIEINSSFYKIPLPPTVKKWSADVPKDFRFTFKLFKGITHASHLAFDLKDIARFFEAINQVGEQKGCILAQFPPSVKIANLDQLSVLMSNLKAFNSCSSWNIALEFRHDSLYTKEVYQRLEENKLGMVIHDKSRVLSPFDHIPTSFIYFRFHGPGGNYRGSYTDRILAQYAGYIAEWLKARKQVYVYFNNTMGEAYVNLSTLKNLVKNLIEY